MAVAKCYYCPSAAFAALVLFVVRCVVLSQQAEKVLNKKGGKEMCLMHVYCVVEDFLLSVSNYSPVVLQAKQCFGITG